MKLKFKRTFLHNECGNEGWRSENVSHEFTWKTQNSYSKFVVAEMNDEINGHNTKCWIVRICTKRNGPVDLN